MKMVKIGDYYVNRDAVSYLDDRSADGWCYLYVSGYCVGVVGLSASQIAALLEADE